MNSQDCLKKKILFLAANPKNMPPLRLDEEIREIDEGLRLARNREQFTLVHKSAVRPRDIRRAMLEHKPQIVHFSGHGQGTPAKGEECRSTTDRDIKPFPENNVGEGLVFEDEIGQAKLVDQVALVGLFELFTDQVECVVLNGCYSEAQAKAVAQHIPYVIGMSQAIGDKAAIELAVGFYDALAAGCSIEEAFGFGRNAIQLAGIPEHLTPVLFRKEEASKDRSSQKLEYPSGPVSLESPLYIERFSNESRCYQSIETPGCLLRIIAPDLMGKTSLMARVVDYGARQQYRKVYVKLSDVERETLTDLNSFLRWFCERIDLDLCLKNEPNNTWDNNALGSIAKCTNYFEKYVLSELEAPLVLGLDEVDRLFPYPTIATDFFAMLRNWFENGKNHNTWKQLRLVLGYSTEDYSQFNINQSPFNVGEPLKLKELSQQQVQDLTNRYGLNWNESQIESLMAMLGGHPYLLQMAMYYVSCRDLTLEQLLEEAATEDGIYIDHLSRYWKTLQKNPRLMEVVERIMTSDVPVQIEQSHRHQLYSMGLIRQIRQNNFVVPSCNLYRLYFSR